MPADTPHMRALKIKRYNLMKGIEETQSKVEKETKKTHQLKTDLEKSLAQKIRSGPNRPVESAFGSLMQEGSSSRTARQAKNRPEKNLDLFQKRLRKKLPASDDVPRKGIQEKVRGTQVTTWRKALDDRLWARRVNEVGVYRLSLIDVLIKYLEQQKMRQMVDDEKVLQQEEKENSRDALVVCHFRNDIKYPSYHDNS